MRQTVHALGRSVASQSILEQCGTGLKQEAGARSTSIGEEIQQSMAPGKGERIVALVHLEPRAGETLNMLYTAWSAG